MGDPSYDTYDNPLIDRYASKEMCYNWSPKQKFSTWRKLWFELARQERALGLEQIKQEYLDTMQLFLELEDRDFESARKHEARVRHDVMAHVHAFGDRLAEHEEQTNAAVRGARGIIHLGATSCEIGDNTDLIQIKDALSIIRKRLLHCAKLMKDFAGQHKQLACLGFTHFQPAQLTTVGKRCCLWLQDLIFDFTELERLYETLPFRGIKGTTGTQASFLELFNGDHDKVRALDENFTRALGFSKSIAVAGQTYTRKIDSQILSLLSHIAETAHKFATDIRLLMNQREVDEPFEESQIGSSAMAYKKNPMRCERICSLSRFVMSLVQNGSQTHANQWFERTLDDSANRRLSLPQAFLAVDGILIIVANVMNGLKVWPTVIRRHVMEELPFMATENILMACVKAGGDRQDLHEAIRKHSVEASRRVKHEGVDNDMLERISKDPLFSVIHDKLNDMLDPQKFIGRAPQQVDEFLAAEVQPILDRYKSDMEQLAKEDINLKV